MSINRIRNDNEKMTRVVVLMTPGEIFMVDRLAETMSQSNALRHTNRSAAIRRAIQVVFEMAAKQHDEENR